MTLGESLTCCVCVVVFSHVTTEELRSRGASGVPTSAAATAAAATAVSTGLPTPPVGEKPLLRRGAETGIFFARESRPRLLDQNTVSLTAAGEEQEAEHQDRQEIDGQVGHRDRFALSLRL